MSMNNQKIKIMEISNNELRKSEHESPVSESLIKQKKLKRKIIGNDGTLNKGKKSKKEKSGKKTLKNLEEINEELIIEYKENPNVSEDIIKTTEHPCSFHSRRHSRTYVPSCQCSSLYDYK